MKRFLFLLAIALLVVPAVCRADEDPRIKLFAGYSIVPIVQGGVSESLQASVKNQQGVTASMALKLFGNVSGKFEFTNINSPTNIKLFLVGPELSLAKYKHGEVFVHVLVGAARSRDTVGLNEELGPVTIKDSAFAAAIGGGFDVLVNKHVGFRLLQFDYLRAPALESITKNHFRASAGLVVKF